MSKPKEDTRTKSNSNLERKESTPAKSNSNLAIHVVAGGSKRSLQETSPEQFSNLGPTQVGSMGISELMMYMQGAMATVFDEKLKNLPTKDDLECLHSEIGKLNNIVNELADENALLKDELQQVKTEHAKLTQEMHHIVNASKRRSLIFRGLDSSKQPATAVNTLCIEVMQIKNFKLAAARKIFEKNGEMAVVADLQSEEMVAEVFKNVKKLAKTTYSVERDISKERQLDKKVLLKIKKDLKSIDASLKIDVRDDKMKVGGKWFHFNSKKELCCGSFDGIQELKSLYKDNLDSYDFTFSKLAENLNKKQKN